MPRIAALVVFVLAPGVSASAQGGAAERSRPALLLEAAAGPVLGMDRLLRGAAVEASAGLDLGGLSASLLAGAAYDASLGAFFAEAGLGLGLGDGLRLVAGGRLPLGSPELAAAGTRWPISAAPWPNRFALAATIVRLSGGGPARPELVAEAELSYSAYRVRAKGGVAAPVPAGLAGFEAGFGARLALRLSWRRGGPARP